VIFLKQEVLKINVIAQSSAQIYWSTRKEVKNKITGVDLIGPRIDFLIAAIKFNPLKWKERHHAGARRNPEIS